MRGGRAGGAEGVSAAAAGGGAAGSAPAATGADERGTGASVARSGSRRIIGTRSGFGASRATSTSISGLVRPRAAASTSVWFSGVRCRPSILTAVRDGTVRQQIQDDRETPAGTRRFDTVVRSVLGKPQGAPAGRPTGVHPARTDERATPRARRARARQGSLPVPADRDPRGRSTPRAAERKARLAGKVRSDRRRLRKNLDWPKGSCPMTSWALPALEDVADQVRDVPQAADDLAMVHRRSFQNE